jgi:hypothetical protein
MAADSPDSSAMPGSVCIGFGPICAAAAWRLHWVGEISGNAEAGFPGFD